MNSNSNSNSRKALFMGSALALIFCIIQAFGAATNHMNADESFILYAWNHPWSQVIGATRINTLAPPGDFILSKFYWMVSSTLWPRLTQEYFELNARVYPLLLVFTGLALLFLTIFDRTKSIVWSVFIASLFLYSGQTLALNAVELRFNAVLFFGASLSWYAFMKFFDVDAESGKLRRFFLLWLFAITFGYWTHIFSVISSGTQVALLAFNWRRSQKLLQEIQWEQPRMRFFFTLLFASAMVFILYFKLKMAYTPSNDSSLCVGAPEALQFWVRAYKYLFPYFTTFVYATAICVGIVFTVKRGLTIKNQIVLMSVPAFLLSFYLAHISSCRNQDFQSRHLCYLYPLMAISAAQALRLIRERFKVLEKKPIAILAALFGLSLAFCQPIQGKAYIAGGDSWVKLRRTLLQHKNLQVKAVAGIIPNGDRTLTVLEDHRYGGTALSWEFYLKGLDGLPRRDSLYSEDLKDGGFEIVSCEDAAVKPVLESTLEGDVLVDFCDAYAVKIRKLR